MLTLRAFLLQAAVCTPMCRNRRPASRASSSRLAPTVRSASCNSASTQIMQVLKADHVTAVAVDELAEQVAHAGNVFRVDGFQERPGQQLRGEVRLAAMNRSASPSSSGL